MTASLTVVVPTVDRVDLLGRCLRGLSQQEPPVEVIVVHDGAPAIVVLLAQWRDRLRVRGLRISERGASEKRNAGWRAADGDYVAFTDDDCEPTAAWARELLTAVTSSGADLVAGPVQPHPDDADVEGLWARTIRSSAPGLYPGCNLLVRRRALADVGGFDEALPAGEDTDLAWRVLDAGGGAGWAPDALVWHAVRPATFRQHLRSLPRWAALPAVVRRHPQLRTHAHRRWFWKDSHPTACLALVAIAASLVDRRAAVGTLPLLVRRVRGHGTRDGLALAVNDVAETVVLVTGSIRHGSVLL